MNNPRTSNLDSRDLYLDLLIKVLTNVIYEDESIDPKTSCINPFRTQLRYEGRDWPKSAHTMVGLKRLQNLRDLTQCVVDCAVPGDLLEAGVWRGGCCILMRGVLAANGVTDRCVYVVDSFAGLPPPNLRKFPKDEGLDLSAFSALAISLEQVRNNFARYGLMDDQVVFVKGLFQDTLPTFNAGPFALIRLDGDLYESTYLSLEYLYPRLSPRGFVLIDDYGALPQCAAAVSDYRARMGISEPIHQVDWTGVWWQKDSQTIESQNCIT